MTLPAVKNYEIPQAVQLIFMFVHANDPRSHNNMLNFNP